jgi:ORC complex protein Cdc6/Orc1
VLSLMNETDELFTREDPIFTDKELLEISHIPDEGRIVGRDEEIQQIANAVNPAIFGQSPSNVLIYGKTGTGKSLCAKYVSTQLIDTADNEGVSASSAYVDCAQDTTETQTVQTIASSLNNQAKTEINIPIKVLVLLHITNAFGIYLIRATTLHSLFLMRSINSKMIVFSCNSLGQGKLGRSHPVRSA